MAELRHACCLYPGRLNEQPVKPFAEYMHMLNARLDEGKRDPTAGLFILPAERSPSELGQFGMAVYAESQEGPVEHYTARWSDGQFELVSRGCGSSSNVVGSPICKVDKTTQPEG